MKITCAKLVGGRGPDQNHDIHLTFLGQLAKTATRLPGTTPPGATSQLPSLAALGNYETELVKVTQQLPAARYLRL